MTRELFVSSTPHETKVGMVEDDQLAEVYLERENEYTLAGSIYKGKVTRVLPGMQSAFVDIGLDGDAFLYVSDFMELTEHDDDVDEVVPTNRGVPQAAQAPIEAPQATEYQAAEETVQEDFVEGAEAVAAPQRNEGRNEPSRAEGEGGDGSRNRFRGGRNRRRRGRRGERMPESRFARPAEPAAPTRTPDSSRPSEYGPPPGYQPIILPGESISKYRHAAQVPAEPVAHESEVHAEDPAVIAQTFPEDEPIFAEAETEPLHEEHGDDVQAIHEDNLHENDIEEQSESIAPAWAVEDSADGSNEDGAADSRPKWRDRFKRIASAFGGSHEARHEEESESTSPDPVQHSHAEPAPPEPLSASVRLSAGTMEEEEIDEEETDLRSYAEDVEEDAAFEELEEETRAAHEHHEHETSGIENTGTENNNSGPTILEFSSEDVAGATNGETAAAEEEIDEEELAIEQAQAEAEALLSGEAPETEVRAEVRAPSGTAGYTQRTQRSGRFDRNNRGRRGGGRRFRPMRREQAPLPLISDLLKEGQEILVQIAKEPIGKKGARITSHIALPGRFLVYMPTVNHTGVSRKISSEEERQRLKRIVLSERENGHGGFIVRTAAQNCSEDELRADIRFLKNLWNEIKNRADGSKPPALIYHDLNVVERVLRDQVTADFSAIWVDTEAEYERILRFANRFQPALVRRVKLYTKETPLFDQFGLAEEINKALKSKVWLKSGGYIVINQTEALVAIDVNTGKYVGKTQRLEDTIVKTNVDAIKEIVRQIRLRDLGGIIVIDFIDMDERRNRQKVMQALEEALRSDRAPSKVLQFNDFGLVAITRKRVKQSLERTIGAPCPYCSSTGFVKSVSTICNEVYVEMRKIAKHLEHSDVLLRVNPEVAKALKNNGGKFLNEMEELTKKTIIVKSDPALHQEQFDIN
jgi:Rne/Rng family ribonuclease